MFSLGFIRRLNNFMLSKSILSHLFFALSIRFIFLIYGEFQDAYFKVKYTDIDYYVFTDAASYVTNGSSPFLRKTYRYTPLLAYMLIPNAIFGKLFGKIIFVIFDVLSGYLIHEMNSHTSKEMRIISASFWLYNPLTIAVSTRGNAESVLCYLILLQLSFFRKNNLKIAALLFGLVVHFKIYPIIYSMPMYFSLQEKRNPSKYFDLRLFVPTLKKILFSILSATFFLLLCSLSYYAYGDDYLNEAFLYHIIRKDTRHNFSLYFYMLYLNHNVESMFISIITFVPQIVLLIVLSFRFSQPSDLPFCLFCQTFVFVIFNKVCTSQYFLWYLCLIPLVFDKLNLSFKKIIFLICIWFMGQAVWLAPAYFLEMKGFNTFTYVWLASLIFFSINVYILQCIICAYNSHHKKAD